VIDVNTGGSGIFVEVRLPVPGGKVLSMAFHLVMVPSTSTQTALLLMNSLTTDGRHGFGRARNGESNQFLVMGVCF
jgi:hypothetical protein